MFGKLPRATVVRVDGGRAVIESGDRLSYPAGAKFARGDEVCVSWSLGFVLHAVEQCDCTIQVGGGPEIFGVPPLPPVSSVD